MIENIDTNFGVLLKKLAEWGIERNTLVIFLTGDNGGLRGGKVMPYQGGVRANAFFRWPDGGIPAGAENTALSAHIDIFPTLAEITGATLTEEVKKQVEGRSLWPLLQNLKTKWPDRTLIHHVGRWAKGRAADSKHDHCVIQNSRFTLVNNTELYDLQTDPGEKKNVISEHPEVVANLRSTYDKWWKETLPLLVNENAIGPKINPMKELYWKQFGGEPDAKLLERMNPNQENSKKAERKTPKRKPADQDSPPKN